MSGWQHSFIREINGYVSRRWPSTGESRHTRTHTCVHTHTHVRTHTRMHAHTQVLEMGIITAQVI